MFKQTLQTLRLVPINPNLPLPPKFPFPQLLVSRPNRTQPNLTQPENAFGGLWNLNGRPPPFRDASETFQILPPAHAEPQKWAELQERSQSSPRQIIWVISPHEIPLAEVTPCFNIASYFEELAQARGADQVSCEFGHHLLYGEAVRSTHSQLIGWVNKQCHSEQNM